MDPLSIGVGSIAIAIVWGLTKLRRKLYTWRVYTVAVNHSDYRKICLAATMIDPIRPGGHFVVKGGIGSVKGNSWTRDGDGDLTVRYVVDSVPGKAFEAFLETLRSASIEKELGNL